MKAKMYQGNLYQGNMYQGKRYQGNVYQGKMYQGHMCQGNIYRDLTAFSASIAESMKLTFSVLIWYTALVYIASGDGGNSLKFPICPRSLF